MAMSGGAYAKSRALSATVTLLDTNDNLITVVGPVKVYRAGIHTIVAKTTGTAGVITLQSVAGVTETALGTITTPDTMAAGEVLYKNFEPPLNVVEGAYLKIEQTTGGGGGNATIKVFVEYTEEPMTKAYLNARVALT